MAYNKVVIDGVIKLDLSGDSLSPDKVLSGFIGHGANGAAFTGSCTYDADTSDATATAENILAGKTAYVNGTKITGTAAVTVNGTNLTFPEGLVSINA